jgi:hypothetical protein
MPGQTVVERIEAIKEGTHSSGIVFRQYFRGDFDDSGFRTEYRDGADQVGHFLQGLFMAHDARSDAQEWLALSLIVGHEMYGDSGNPSGIGVISGVNAITQLTMGATHPEARERFLRGGDDNFRYILDQNPFPSLANGNSIEDLRLSYRAWELGKMLQMGELDDLDEVADWIRDEIIAGE